MSDEHSPPAPSFARDVRPILQPYRANMIWRLDLLDYGAVKANAAIIFGQISSESMPPPPMPPLNAGELDIFKRWMDQGCLP